MKTLTDEVNVSFCYIVFAIVFINLFNFALKNDILKYMYSIYFTCFAQASNNFIIIAIENNFVNY